MREKEKGYILSIDQASIAAGVSLWHNGELIAWTVLSGGNKKVPMSKRLHLQRNQLEEFLKEHCKGVVSTVLFEEVKSKFVQMICGAYLTVGQICCRVGKDHFIHTRSWKSYAHRQGAEGPVKDIKGVAALEGIGWDFTEFPIDSDDVADSILFYLYFKNS